MLGSADLTPSNNTKTKNLTVVAPGQYGGRYIHYGIREHGMAAAMNGLRSMAALRPAGATFLVFTDYARPAIRIAALSGIPAIYVMTHDSIGLGEDGPTHQPVEHLAALRAMPNCASSARPTRSRRRNAGTSRSSARRADRAGADPPGTAAAARRGRRGEPLRRRRL